MSQYDALCWAGELYRSKTLAGFTTDTLDQRLAWDRLLQGGVSIEGSSVVFDVDIKDPEEIDRAKAAGVSVLVHPGINLQREVQLVERANTVGMALVATGVSFRKI